MILPNYPREVCEGFQEAGGGGDGGVGAGEDVDVVVFYGLNR